MQVNPAALRQEMRLRGLTGAELARRAGVSPATISHALNGRRIHPAKRHAIHTVLQRVEPLLSLDVTLPHATAPGDAPSRGQRPGSSSAQHRSGYVRADSTAFLRMAHGYSYREIAREAMMSPTTVSRIAAGLPVRPSVLRRAGAALIRLQGDQSVAALLGRADVPPT